VSDTRYAVVSGGTAEAIEGYLPANYRMVCPVADVFNGELSSRPLPGFLIAGEDDSGWTLDEYVIPRLRSGLYGCREVDAAESVVMRAATVMGA
jgi:hypothetical protein